MYAKTNVKIHKYMYFGKEEMCTVARTCKKGISHVFCYILEWKLLVEFEDLFG